MFTHRADLFRIALLTAMLSVGDARVRAGENTPDSLMTRPPTPWVSIEDVGPEAEPAAPAIHEPAATPEFGPLTCCCELPQFRGPVAPRSLRLEADLEHAWPTFRDDVRGVFSGRNLAWLTVAAGAAIGLRESVDDRVRDNTARHPQRWGSGSEVIGRFGEVQYQVPVLLGAFAWSLHEDDEGLHRLTTTMISAYAITGLTTVALKGLTNTERPSDEWNGGEFGFPSFHAASSFSIAAVLDEAYGARYGVPAYAVAGLIAWSRIDERDHDVSDVVFGAALGLIVGKAVAGRRFRGDSRVRMLPYVDPRSGGAGWMFDLRF